MEDFESRSKEAVVVAESGPSVTTLLDVRGADEFATGHLTDAVNVPIGELGDRLGELGAKDRPIAVYCRSGRRSAVAARLLREAGFASVTDLGGLADGDPIVLNH